MDNEWSILSLSLHLLDYDKYTCLNWINNINCANLIVIVRN